MFGYSGLFAVGETDGMDLPAPSNARIFEKTGHRA